MSDAPAEALRLFQQALEPSGEITAAARAEILAEVGGALCESLDYLVTLPSLARIVVPRLCDWCCVAVVDEADSFRRVAVLHRDAARAVTCRAYAELAPAPGSPPSRLDAIPTDGPVLRSGITDEMIATLAADARQENILRELGLRACIVAPIVARGVPFGTLTFAISDDQRSFGTSELELAADLARRAALAIDSARLLRDAEQRHAAERRAREQAEAATRTKDEFLALLAHELRNPLSVVVTAVELMKWKGEPNLGHECAIIERQVARLVRLVDDVTEVSRLARGKIEPGRSTVELERIVAGAIELSAPVLTELSCDLDREAAPDLSVRGDAARLTRLIAAIIADAAEHTAQKGRITIRAERDGAWVCLRISNGGAVGHGPRLALARAMALLHGGALVVRGKEQDRGTEVELRLPAAEPETMVPASEHASSSQRTPGTPRRVLVVDDNVDSAELIAEFLRAVGHEVAVAHDGPSALALSGELRPQVAILDIGLPAMDGYELAVRLTEQHGATTPRLIALTGYGHDQDRERSRRAGFASHCVKPIDTRVLLRVIDED